MRLAYPWPMRVGWDASQDQGALCPSLRPGNGVTREVDHSPTGRLLEFLPPR